MAREKFNILHGVFWEALRDVVDAFERQGVPYAVVGGTAAQVWIAAMLTREGDLSVDEPVEVALRLRTTRDVDLSTRSTAAEVLEVLNVLAATSRPPVTVLSPRAARLREVLVNLTLEPSDVSGFSEHYDGMLSRAVTLRIRRGTEVLEPRVVALADLLATKLSRKSIQAKDLLDVDAICATLQESGRRVSCRVIQEVLGPEAGLLDDYQGRYPEAFTS